jgi:hypothetical protein
MIMTKRARDIRRLAGLLTTKSGTSVRIYYDRAVRRYRVVWTDGPDVAQMFTLAITCANTDLDVDVPTLLWHRDTTANTSTG